MGPQPLIPVAGLITLVLGAYVGRGRVSGGKALDPGEFKKARKPRRSTEIKEFLNIDSQEGFDIEALNSIDIRVLTKEAPADKELAREVMAKIESLILRIRSETEDPAPAGAILRNKTLDWYRRSPSTRTWSEEMAPRWGGIFHESKVPGGRLSPKLSVRMAGLHAECAKASGWGFLRGRAIDKLLTKGPKRSNPPLIPAVAQAYLDDLARSRRVPDRPIGMERISELARRVGQAEMNRTLGQIFRHEGTGPVTVIDTRYNPDIGTVAVRPPSPRAAGDAVSYDLVHTKVSAAGPSMGPDLGTTDAGSPWERGPVAQKDWEGILGLLQKQKGKLDPPPIENYRNNESYLELRAVIVTDETARRAFLTIRWKGKPSGLALLAELLAEGSFIPDVETDGDYLEAELGHLEKGDTNYRPKEGRWTVGEIKIVREVAEGNVRTYRVDGKLKD